MLHYVTQDGWAAAHDPHARRLILGALQQETPSMVRVCRRRGWIAPERRQTSYTALVLATGAPSRPLVRYRPTGRKPRTARTGALARVYARLVAGPADGLSTPELVTGLPDLEPNTIRWAIQVLRQQGLVRTVTARSAVA
jgi:hypothetical protein